MHWMRWCAALALCPGALTAQTRDDSPLRPEVRADAIFARATTLHAGVGIAIRTGYNVRVHLVGAGGVAQKGGASESSVRGDGTLRLLLDPFGENRFGLSVGGGLSVLYDGFEGTRPVGVLLIALEGRPRAALVWSLEAALGGGTRVGLVLRPRVRRYR